MSLLAFKNYLKIRWNIIKINSLEGLMTTFSYSLDTFLDIIFSIFFTIFTIIFINIIYGNVNSIVGYSKQEMMFFQFIGQINFFLNVMWSSDNIQSLISNVNKGDLDLILSKPIPHLFYITLRKIDIVYAIKGLIPSLIALIFAIDWSQLSFKFENIIWGFFILVMGQICLHVFQFICGLFVFAKGGGNQFASLSWVFEYNVGRMIPYEGFDLKYKLIFMTIIPVIISTGISTSVILGKTNGFLFFVISFLLSIVLLFLKTFLWKIALKNYSSASS